MTAAETLEAPFTWVGGKRRVAHVVWRAFGDVPNFIEPFFGSGAVLLGRPGGAGKIETVNDIDGGLVNFWRAIKWAPHETAEWCNWPVSELDLHARHAWLVQRLDGMAETLRKDPKFFDVQVAGWWVWGIAQWIGTGWCGGPKRGRPRPNLNSGQGVHKLARKRPVVGGTNPGRGVHRQLPRISATDGSPGESGVLRRNLPSIGNDRGLNGVAAPPALEWFESLAERFRRVRIVCGDWRRVLGPSVLGKGKNVGGRKPTGVFFDAPYDPELRQPNMYAHDDAGLSKLVRDWAVEHGDDPDLRIALCGYEGEHNMPASWRVHAWKGARGYAGEDNDNRERERIWFSPHCLPIEEERERAQVTMFLELGKEEDDMLAVDLRKQIEDLERQNAQLVEERDDAVRKLGEAEKTIAQQSEELASKTKEAEELQEKLEAAEENASDDDDESEPTGDVDEIAAAVHDLLRTKQLVRPEDDFPFAVASADWRADLYRAVEEGFS